MNKVYIINCDSIFSKELNHNITAYLESMDITIDKIFSHDNTNTLSTAKSLAKIFSEHCALSTISNDELKNIFSHSNTFKENILIVLETYLLKELFCSLFGNEMISFKDNSIVCLEYGEDKKWKIEWTITSKILNFITNKNEKTSKENKLIKSQYKELELDFHTILDHSSDFFYMKDSDYKFHAVNENFAKLTGHKHWKEIIDKTDFDLFSEEDAQKYRIDDTKVIEGGEPVLGRIESYPLEDGTEGWVKTSKIPIYNENGKVVRMFGFSAEVTQLIRAREKSENLLRQVELQKSEFESIFKNSTDGIAIVDLSSKFLNFNDAFLQMTGYLRDELLEKNSVDLSIPEDKEKSIRANKIVLEEGHIENFEKTYITKDGERIFVNITASMLPDKKRIVLVVKNITSLKQIEQQLKLASLGEMIGNIAHQWRQPLSIITMSVSSLFLKSEFDEKVTHDDIKKVNDSILSQSQYLSDTIEDFRNYIASDSEKKSLKVKDIIIKSITLTEAVLLGNFINLINTSIDDLSIKGSLSELVQSIINIINNSKDILIENNKEDDRYIFIESKKLENNSLELKIYDNAGGISSEILPYIFEPYFTTKHKSIGVGLGLSMTDQIIRERHNQIITAENKEFEYNNKQYKGACFTIIFK